MTEKSKRRQRLKMLGDIVRGGGKPPVAGSATGYAAPADIIGVRAAKVADEIFAICADATPGELSQHQLVTAVIARELRKQHNNQALRSAPTADAERKRNDEKH